MTEPLAAPDDWATVAFALSRGSQRQHWEARDALARLRADSHTKTEALRGEWKDAWTCDRGLFNPYPAAVCQWCGLAAAAAAPKETT